MAGITTMPKHSHSPIAKKRCRIKTMEGNSLLAVLYFWPLHVVNVFVSSPSHLRTLCSNQTGVLNYHLTRP